MSLTSWSYSSLCSCLPILLLPLAHKFNWAPWFSVFHKSASCPNFLQRKLDISYVKIFDLDIKSYNETQRTGVWKCEIKTSMVSFRQTILFQKYKFLHATIFTRKVPQTPEVIHVTYFLIIKITPPPKILPDLTWWSGRWVFIFHYHWLWEQYITSSAVI